MYVVGLTSSTEASFWIGEHFYAVAAWLVNHVVHSWPNPDRVLLRFEFDCNSLDSTDPVERLMQRVEIVDLQGEVVEADVSFAIGCDWVIGER